MKLTVRQQCFVEEYLVDLNGTQAAIRAGYSAKGADVTASKLLVNPKVMRAVAAAMKERSERTKVDADFVLLHASEILKSDIGDILNDDNTFKPVKEWPAIWRQQLTGMEVQRLFDGHGEERKATGEVVKIRFLDRLRTLEIAGKHVDVRAFEERKVIEHKGRVMLDRAVSEIDRVIADAIGRNKDSDIPTPRPH